VKKGTKWTKVGTESQPVQKMSELEDKKLRLESHSQQVGFLIALMRRDVEDVKRLADSVVGDLEREIKRFEEEPESSAYRLAGSVIQGLGTLGGNAAWKLQSLPDRAAEIATCRAKMVELMAEIQVLEQAEAAARLEAEVQAAEMGAMQQAKEVVS
jgi:hypothetical protein